MIFALATITGCCYSQNAAEQALYVNAYPPKSVDYKAMPGDLINFRSDTIREFAPNKYRSGYLAEIDPKGKVDLPLLGKRKIADKTTGQIDIELNRAIRKYYTQGNIASEVRAYKSQYFIVMGEVHRPGRRAWTGKQTLLEAVVKSYPTLSSWPQRVLIFRKVSAGKKYDYIESSPAVINAKKINADTKKIVVNLDEMIYFKDMKNNFLLMPGDVIYIQLNPLAYLGRAIQDAFTPDKPTYKPVDNNQNPKRNEN